MPCKKTIKTLGLAIFTLLMEKEDKRVFSAEAERIWLAHY